MNLLTPEYATKLYSYPEYKKNLQTVYNTEGFYPAVPVILLHGFDFCNQLLEHSFRITKKHGGFRLVEQRIRNPRISGMHRTLVDNYLFRLVYFEDLHAINRT